MYGNGHTPQQGLAQTRLRGAWRWVGVGIRGAVRCGRRPRGALQGPPLKPERGRARSEGTGQLLSPLSPRPPARPLLRPDCTGPRNPTPPDLARRLGARCMRPLRTPSPSARPQPRT